MDTVFTFCGNTLTLFFPIHGMLYNIQVLCCVLSIWRDAHVLLEYLLSKADLILISGFPWKIFVKIFKWYLILPMVVVSFKLLFSRDLISRSSDAPSIKSHAAHRNAGLFCYTLYLQLSLLIASCDRHDKVFVLICIKWHDYKGHVTDDPSCQLLGREIHSCLFTEGG